VTAGYGFDFGTATSTVAVDRAVAAGGRARRSFSCPSVAAELPGGSLVFGAAAEAARIEQRGVHRAQFKRDIGDPTPLWLDTRRAPAHELAAGLLAGLLAAIAEPAIESEALLTIAVPAAWEQSRSRLMRQAAELAGWDPARIRLVAEPVAAAMHAFAPTPQPGELCLVYDLGVGGFRCAVVDLGAAADGLPMSLLGSPDGVADLGGADFDRPVRDAVREQFPESTARLLDGADPSRQAYPHRVLFADRCEQIRIRLSSAESCVCSIGELDPPEVFRLTRDELVARATPLLRETYAACDRLLESLGREWADIRCILPVGAACRMTQLLEPLARHSGRPVVHVDEPELAVARGAARGSRLRLRGETRPLVSEPFRPERSPFDRSV